VEFAQIRWRQIRYGTNFYPAPCTASNGSIDTKSIEGAKTLKMWARRKCSHRKLVYSAIGSARANNRRYSIPPRHCDSQAAQELIIQWNIGLGR